MPERKVVETICIERLWSVHQPAINAHFARLDRNTLRLRFGGDVRPTFVAGYARHILDLDAVVFGAIARDRVVAVAELHGLFGVSPSAAEAAFSVEPEWQDMGIGNALMSNVIAIAKTRGIASVHMSYLSENERMQRLAQRHNAVTKAAAHRHAEVFRDRWSSLHSIATAFAGETAALVHAVLQPAQTA